MDKNENNHYRGLHLVVIDPKSGTIQLSRVFDTYFSSTQLENTIDEILDCDGFIIVVACKDECISQLSNKCKLWF